MENNETTTPAMSGSTDVEKETSDKQAFGKKEDVLRKGEKGFTIVLFAVAAFFLYQSILLWIKKPGIDGPAIIPLLSSGLVTLLTLFEIIQNIRKKTEIKKGARFKDMLGQVCKYLLSLNVLIAICAILIYCALLKAGVSFYIITPAFLWGLMTFYSKGNYLKNVIWTAICMGFVFLVFRLLFNVMMP